MSSDSPPPFFVQVGVPRLNDGHATSFVDLQEAIGRIFAWPSEFIICYINGIAIPFSYIYDLSDHIEPGIELLEIVLANETGNVRGGFASNSLLVDLNLHWDRDSIQIVANWSRAAGDIESIRKNCSNISMPKSAFLAECKAILDVVARYVRESRVTLEDSEAQRRLQILSSTIAALGSHAYLY